ncbi:MAG: cytochrome b6-f complex iron-sulfur subunit [Phycisphaerales bacterium]|jgi:cytochrome b6-f complex iron-sulfur subunit|nr:cytochrome b6-f complex iron-sulfur subunit [Phycisphaerales bacterium]
MSSEIEMNRRNFVVLATVGAAVAACACESALAADAPAGEGKEKESPKAPPPNVGTVNVGKKAKYDKDGVSDEFAKKNRVLVVRHEGKIYAPTATCTHKNCAVKLKENAKQEKEIVCPCHGSKFTVQGTSLKGPAKGSLYRYGLSVNADGDIIVDKEKQFSEKEWEKDGAFITV